MSLSPSRATQIALPPVAASVIILTIAGVSAGVWAMHAIAIALSLAIAVAGPRLRPHDVAVFALTIVALALTLFLPSSGPSRWLTLGAVRLYIAPVVLPSFVAAVSIALRARTVLASAAAIAAMVLLALQPDASQALALIVALGVVFAQERGRMSVAAGTLVAMAVIAAWAFTRPDPLIPVPWVEGVFALALGDSTLAGLFVVASAIALVVGLVRASMHGPRWLAGVAAYYAVLFVCSVKGLTPAPLIGFGAGPLLGFGFMCSQAHSSTRSM